VSTDRQEPKISLSIDDEDIIPPAAPKKPAQASMPQGEPAKAGGGGFVMFMLTVLVLLLSGVAYYLYDQLSATQTQLLASQDRLDALEMRLSSADESISESTVTTSVKLNELDQEVRKLWDNVWKKQKDELAQHEATLAKQQSEMDKSLKRIVALEAKLKTSDEQLNKIAKSYNSDRESFTSMSGKLDRVIAQAEVNKKELLNMGKQVASGGGLDARVKDVERRITQNEEWLDSVNAFRKQVNRDIESMRQTMTQYHSGSPALR
jgi:chromosome segregation ATPase|tara:strand:- start:5969 stop:6760 length:792 start_codon:yes stop_codon:yes gene_type:complete